MLCAEFESRFNDVLDQRRWLDADPALSEHMQCCHSCAALAGSYEAMITGLDQLAIPTPSADLTARVLSALSNHVAGAETPDVIRGDFKRRPQFQRTDIRRPMGRFVRPLYGTAAVAALVVIYAVWQAPATNGSREKENDGTLAGKASIAARDEASGHAAARSISPAEVAPTMPHRSLAEETANSLAAAMHLFPGVGEPAPASSTYDSSADSGAAWVHGVSDGLKPVTRTTAGAMNAFIELLAGGEGSRS